MTGSCKYDLERRTPVVRYKYSFETESPKYKIMKPFRYGPVLVLFIELKVSHIQHNFLKYDPNKYSVVFY